MLTDYSIEISEKIRLYAFIFFVFLFETISVVIDQYLGIFAAEGGLSPQKIDILYLCQFRIVTDRIPP